MISGFDYERHDAVALADLVKRGEVSALELVECAIAAIEQRNPKLNAVVTRMDELARARAKEALGDGALAGVPMLLKDLTAPCAGVRMTFGSRYFSEYSATHDSELVRRYKAAGMLIVGKANTSEFGLLPVTEPDLFGPCSTPWDLSRTAGGSSGGSASAVAAGIVPIAHGSDGGGSLRIPASCCGIFGFKPSRGRLPTGPDTGEAWLGLGVEHALTRSVRDSATLLELTSAPDPTAPYFAPPPARPYREELSREPGKLRIAFTTQPHLPAAVHPDCIAAVHDAAKLCESLGHSVEEASPKVDSPALAKAFFELVCAAAASALVMGEEALGKPARREDFETGTWILAQLGRGIDSGAFLASKRKLEVHARRALAFYNDYDILLTPTLGRPPLRHGALKARGWEAWAQEALSRAPVGARLLHDRIIDTSVNRVFQFIPFTPLANVTGQPSMSVPLFWNSEGLPIGSLFTARNGAEGTLFQLAAQLERARPWFQRRPTGIGL